LQFVSYASPSQSNYPDLRFAPGDELDDQKILRHPRLLIRDAGVSEKWLPKARESSIIRVVRPDDQLTLGNVHWLTEPFKRLARGISSDIR